MNSHKFSLLTVQFFKNKTISKNSNNWLKALINSVAKFAHRYLLIYRHLNHTLQNAMKIQNAMKRILQIINYVKIHLSHINPLRLTISHINRIINHKRLGVSTNKKNQESMNHSMI